MDDTSYVNLSLTKYNELYDKAKKYDDRIKFTDETGYVLISEIIKAHAAEHTDDIAIFNNCEQALTILTMLKDE